MFASLVNPTMYVVTCAADAEQSGCLVEFATQCSIEPPRFLVCLSVVNHTYKVAERASALTVHLLDEDDEELASLFGGTTGDVTDKFSKVAWRVGATGAPVLEQSAAYFEGAIVQRIPFGDHVGFVLEPIAQDDSNAVAGEQLLTFDDVKDLTPGHPIGGAGSASGTESGNDQ